MKLVLISILFVGAFSNFSEAKEKKSPARQPNSVMGVRGTGPLHIVCDDGKGSQKIYNANRLVYTSDTKVLTAIGFGPNPQDDGVEPLEGNCAVGTNKNDLCSAPCSYTDASGEVRTGGECRADKTGKSKCVAPGEALD